MFVVNPFYETPNGKPHGAEKREQRGASASHVVISNVLPSTGDFNLTFISQFDDVTKLENYNKKRYESPVESNDRWKTPFITRQSISL